MNQQEAQNRLTHLDVAAKTTQSLLRSLEAAQADAPRQAAEDLAKSIGEHQLQLCPEAHPGPWLVWIYDGKSCFAGANGSLVDASDPSEAKRFSDFREAVATAVVNDGRVIPEKHFGSGNHQASIWPRT